MTDQRPSISLMGRYSLSDAARLMGVARATVYRWVADGKLTVRTRRCNSRRFVLGRELIELWESYC